ncbi:glycosyltransferase [Verrucomicrobium spinosum]|uniref:glycosyltransferase n=1 Tax=Verrucomicrobium spinosum TaxID=2736 RepID=UPI003CCCA4B7
MCTGRYVISLDHDDEWDPDFLERAIQAIEYHHADTIWMNFRISGIRDRADCLATSPSRRKLFARQTEKSWLMPYDQACRFYLGRMAPLSNSALLYRRDKLGPGWYEKAMMQMTGSSWPDCSWTRKSNPASSPPLHGPNMKTEATGPSGPKKRAGAACTTSPMPGSTTRPR